MYLTAQEAADELGVSVATLYAYVGRKQIRSQRVPNSRSRQYWAQDIRDLKRSTRDDQGDALVPTSTVTLITPDGPFYRGRSAVDLAETETLESVCTILWGTEAIHAFDEAPFRQPAIYDNVLREMDSASLVEKACALLPLLERANPRAFDLSPAGYCRTGAQVIRWFTSLICGQDDLSTQPIHEQIADGLQAPPGFADLIRRMLVLAADHELDPTTYAVRAVANTGVSPYQIVVAGLASATGRRLSFGRTEALSAMLGEIVTGSDPEEPVLRRVREGEPIYGFGSRVYPDGDPRARALLEWLEALDPSDPDFIKLKRAIAVAQEVIGLPPDFVLPISFIGRKLGLVGREVTLLRLARIAGWIAHATEQYHSQNLMRPRTVYMGTLPG